MTSDDQIELNIRSILQQIKKNTNAKIILIAPYVLDYQDDLRSKMRADIVSVHERIRKLADEYADVYIPLDKLLAEAVANQPSPLYYSRDAVHPNQNGAVLIGEHYARYAAPLIEELINKED
jgi:lysophospholipase L1-like esterase